MFSLLKMIFPSAKIKKNDDGSADIQYSEPTHLNTKICSKAQIQPLKNILDNAGVRR